VPTSDKPKLQAVSSASPGVSDMQVNPAVADLVKQWVEALEELGVSSNCGACGAFARPP
jgi:bacterioferritin-associated ferredoxin